MGQSIEFPRPDGGGCRGYLASAGEVGRAVVVIQEWWGVNDQICGVVDRFARSGITALAPDLYHGRVTQEPDEARHLMNGLDFAGATHEDIRGAVRYLGQAGGRVAVMGFCMGGALALAAAVHVPEVAAAVGFYGIPPRDFADPAALRVPYQGHFAERDAAFPPAAVSALEQALRTSGNPVEMYRYDAAHAFFNERRADVYDAACANLAWSRLQEFLARHL
jgi:carboxymethylenebutenolidase